MDLTELERLPGAAHANFEVLTRAIVSRRYGALGTLRERRQQPGVEFYLRVEHAGVLGDPDRVWGWSCKWFLLGGDNELTSGQRKQIEESVDKAMKYVGGLTDFVLCLPQRPAKKDEEWIDGLGVARGISTKLWAAENFDAELSGFDELRSTFFGELVLSPDVLAKAHERSVAPVRGRWVPPLHTSNHVERLLERALLRPASFDRLGEHVDAIAARAARSRRTSSHESRDGWVRAAGRRVDLPSVGWRPCPSAMHTSSVPCHAIRNKSSGTQSCRRWCPNGGESCRTRACGS